MIAWIKAFHVISMVAWFAGLFYLPRLFVYHTQAKDAISYERFKVMEYKLFFYIMSPAAILTAVFGFWLLSLNYVAYSHMMWLHIKLILVALLALFHLYCGKLLYDFRCHENKHSEKFFRIINEFPTVILICVVILTFVKPGF